jgi:heme-degrading monooxygenase HmoA
MAFAANTPEPPYYAVCFAAETTGDAMEDYSKLSKLLYAKADKLEGYLGEEGLSGGPHELNITYWRDLETVKAWTKDAEHQVAMKLGREKWFKNFTVRVAKVERAYSFEKLD